MTSKPSTVWQAEFWGAQAPRLLPIAPSRSDVLFNLKMISAGAPKSAGEGACPPQQKK